MRLIDVLTSTVIATAGLGLAVSTSLAANDEETRPPSATAPDDTGVNVRDRDGATKTPMDQSNDPADVEVTRQIRQGITDADSLGMNARNVKVITSNGVVTLRGPVTSAAERSTIETIARNTAGVKRVENQIEVESSAKRED
jgi:osmotically-inducible protein OsmY